ncbi:MAG: type I restriction-modification system subunit M N-terminal domain-containing protein [Methanosarcinaceae archaeon]|nr:type I restriction-modification system subunit M N-terminal domain-containing protein [Methanosarcinaceae archaeon]
MALSLNKTKLDNLTTDIWNSAIRLRGKFKAYEYQSAILPIIVIRRLECVLLVWREAKSAEVLAKRPNHHPHRLPQVADPRMCHRPAADHGSGCGAGAHGEGSEMIVEVSEKIGRLKIAKGAWKNNIYNFIHKNWKQICVHLRSSAVCISAQLKDTVVRV